MINISQFILIILSLLTIFVFIYLAEFRPEHSSYNYSKTEPTLSGESNLISTSSTKISQVQTEAIEVKILEDEVAIEEPSFMLAEPIQNADIKWGVFAGSNPNTIGEFENKISVNPDYLAFFVHWGNGGGSLPKFLKTLAFEKDRTLVIFWEPSDFTNDSVNQPLFSYRAILSGSLDTYIESFKNQLKLYGGPVILIPFSEANGRWTPWHGFNSGNTVSEAVAGFQYLKDSFRDLETVKFGWAMNANSVPNTKANAIENYYPGDNYVDYVGLDGFNTGDPWLSFDEIFGSGLETIAKYDKPMFIFSFASAEGPKKSEWINDALNTQMPKYENLEGWIWFNQNKEHNWLLWSDNNSLETFTSTVENL